MSSMSCLNCCPNETRFYPGESTQPPFAKGGQGGIYKPKETIILALALVLTQFLRSSEIRGC